MTGVEIQYLLGLYFLVVSLTYTGGRVTADVVKLAFAILFLVLAFVGTSFVH